MGIETVPLLCLCVSIRGHSWHSSLVWSSKMSSGSQPHLPGLLSFRRPLPLLGHTGRENNQKDCQSLQELVR
ncbi:hypothetical protein LEMLEM_LOCUS3814 [Lemmus lemmus]